MILPGGWPDVAGWLAGEGQPGPPSWGVVKAGAARLGQCVNAVTGTASSMRLLNCPARGCRVRFSRWPAACGPGCIVCRVRQRGRAVTGAASAAGAV